MTRQEAAIQYLEANYLQFNRLRYDVVGGKPTWLERLIPPELRAYCCKLANTTQINKDDRLRLAEFGLINLDELDSMSSRELNTMKSIITASDVNERVAYGNIKKPMPLNRLGVLLGTAGYKDVRHKIGGVRTRGWLVYQRSTDEINANKNLYAK